MSFSYRNFHPDKRTVGFFLALGLLGACGIWLLAYSTPFGLGLNDDSIAYIAGARSILSGNGYRTIWLASNSPVTHFPPGFPFVLAVIGYFIGLDPIRGARALNGLVFGLNIVLTGWLGFRMARNRVAGILGAFLTLISSSLLYIHARAMSEPLYLLLMLLAFSMLEWYFHQKRTYPLILIGTVLGWAYLTRYAALALLATCLVVLLVVHEDWRKRVSSVLVLSVSSLPWALAWSVRNRLVGGSFANRVLGWHPITFENWELGVSTFADFLVPVFSWRRVLANIPGFYEVLLVGVGLALLFWVLKMGIPRFLHPAAATNPPVLTFINVLYVMVYLLALVATMTLFDPATKFQVRILSPTFIPLILISVTLGIWLWHRRGPLFKLVLLLTMVGFIGMFSVGQLEAIQHLRTGGGAFANEKWSQAEAILAITELPEDVLVLSNEPGLVYLYTGRSSGVLPKTEPGISDLKPYVLSGKIVIALFRVNEADTQTLEYYYALGKGLHLSDYSSAWIFSAFPK